MPITEPSAEAAPARWGHRLLWFVGLWATGSFVVAGVAYALRLVLHP